MAAGGAGAAIAGAARGGTSLAGASVGAFRAGAMGESGLSAVVSGAGGMAKAGANAAVANPLRRAAADLGGRFTSGARAGFEASGGAGAGGAAEASPSAAASASAGGPPAWARRMQRGQALDKGVSTATHAIKSGDGGGAGSSVDLSEPRE